MWFIFLKERVLISVKEAVQRPRDGDIASCFILFVPTKIKVILKKNSLYISLLFSVTVNCTLKSFSSPVQGMFSVRVPLLSPSCPCSTEATGI